ncbi:MAG: OprO/OprP family phosphate-selective porin, partial [Methylococcales bacterium]
VLLCAVAVSNITAAADKELLDILLKNGIITQIQHDGLSQKEASVAGNDLLEILKQNGAISNEQFSQLTKNRSAAATVASAPAASSAEAKEPETAHVTLGEKGLEIESADGNFKWKLGGRIQVDTQVSYNDNGPPGTDLATSAGFRRARLYTEGLLFKDYEYRFEYDWARNGGGINGITDAYIRYIHFKPFALTIGQTNEGKSMESVMSNNYLTFVERSLPNNAFIEAGPASKYQVGIIGDAYAKLFEMPWTLRGGLTTESVGAPAPGNSSANTAAGNSQRNGFSGDTSYQLVGRATILPFKDQNGNLIHTGVWGSWRSVNNHFNPDGTLRSGGWQFVAQPDTNVDRTNFVNTGNLTSGIRGTSGFREANSVAMFGAELAGAFGPFHAEAEYMQAQISGHGYTDDNVLQGYYVQGGWFLTGETRPYNEKKGTWDRLIPERNFLFDNGWGAWELAARYDSVDLNSENIRGGTLSAGTLGLNWYLSPRVRLMMDWVHVFKTQTASSGVCSYPATGNAPVNAPIACFNHLNPDILETAVRFDF